MTKKLLIANRGEVVARVARSARELGWEVVTIYASDDRASPHTLLGDESYEVPSYTSIDDIVEVAVKAGVDVVHPGYGFLAENPKFAREVLRHGIEWAGPNPDVMELLGDKFQAKTVAERLGVPTPPWCTIKSAYDVEKCYEKLGGGPVVIKASLGGGGRGQRIAYTLEEAVRAFELVSREAEGTVFMEKYFSEVHHVEVQIAGDRHGGVVHLFERECSLQRRQQKVVEEAPSPILWGRDEKRSELLSYAVRIAESVGYDSLGTFEFIYDDSTGNLYFIEANTRLQVEHGVTEAVTGVDLVKIQLLTAVGKELPVRQSDIVVRGWAIEARVYAEDPFNGFTPQEGRILKYREPRGPGIRVDSIAREGMPINPSYDTLIAKVIVWGSDRSEALARLREALNDMVVGGVKTNLDILRRLTYVKEFVYGDYHTTFLHKILPGLLEEARRVRRLIAKALTAVSYNFNGSLSAPHTHNGNGGLYFVPRYGWLAAGINGDGFTWQG